jgi:type IV pilus assembly protein PilY1
MTPNNLNRMMPALRGARLVLAATLALCVGVAARAQIVSQNPLSVGGNVPGNLMLTPSVEFPTLNSKANLGAYSSATTYVGYFDPFKCYRYSYNATESLRHFFPARQLTGPAVCSAASMEWSGNWLNWATTQTIDPFRKALTGGWRVRDTVTETWLQKARHDGQGGITYFPNANTTGGATVSGVIPTTVWTTVRTRVVGAGYSLLFTSSSCPGPNTIDAGITAIDYNPAVHVLDNAAVAPAATIACPSPATTVAVTNGNRVYRVSVRVKVCDASVGLEANCVAYGSNYKPEGLIQKYSQKIRFSIFGYLVDNGMYRDGGVMRARQKFVGPTMLDKATQAPVVNPAREWSPTTGQFVTNPDSADAAATTTAVGDPINYPITNSGVINYLNKFGSMTSANAKNYDPVSELYYTALRYIRKLPPVPTYSTLATQYASAGGAAVAAGAARYNLADGFPVITDWYPASNPDPFEYYCQSTAILGIGDVYTHRDKNLKGTASTNQEPTMPALVSSDPIVNDVAWWTQRAYALEGVPLNVPLASGLQNSPYMVGLAYYAHTQDLRTETEMEDEQTVSTHWVDVREAQRIEPRIRNQYWMAAKYGGFAVPDDFNSLTHTTALPSTWWTNGDTLTSNSGDWANETFSRATNYYVADRPQTMVDSLTRAFAKISAERAGSGTSLAANSTRLDTETRVFQAQFRNGSWLGQLESFPFVSGALSGTPDWRAGEQMPAWNARNIRFHDPQNTGGSSYKPFLWGNLGSNQQTAFNSLAIVAPATGTHIVDYILGDQSREESQTGGTLRTRTSPEPGWSPILGDIVNSTPVFVGAPNGRLYERNPGNWSGKSQYPAFATANANRTALIWVGANDGMMHAFNADTGQEVYAFIPNAAIENGLPNVADPDYEHRYFVDGDMAIADVWNGTEWRTILVGTMGRGGPGMFALDITTPPTVSGAGANSVQFLWERDASDIPELGRNIGRPVIAQVADGDWRVIFGNGPDSADGTAKLIMIDVFSGATTVVDTDGVGSNGLSAVLARDTNSDGLSDTAYAGDLSGRVWKFSDLAGTPTAFALFQTEDPGGARQPITAAPLVLTDTSGSYIDWVFVGTGSYLNESDRVNTQVQSWYGFEDTGVAVTRGELLPRTTWNVGQVGDFLGRLVDVPVGGDMTGYRGWYMDLPDSGERMVVPNRFQGGSLIGTTRVPDASDVCRPSGSGWIMAINPFTGGRLDTDFFDMNNDGIHDEGDRNDDSGTAWDDDDDLREVVSGLGEEVSQNNPIFIENKMCYTMDDGTTRCVTIQGGGTDARRGSWREITN